jgi:short-subunit dehydrogenase
VTQSGFFDQARMHHSGLVTKHLPTSEEVGRAGYRAMQRGKAVYVVGFLNRLVIFGVRFVPRSLVTMIAGMVTAPRR